DLCSGITSLFRLRGRVDKEFLQKLEERLYLADVGSTATSEIVERVRQAFLDKEITGDVELFVKNQLKELVAEGHIAVNYNLSGPTIIMLAGVNGSRKTRSIAQLAKKLKDQGKKVSVAACDTLRAAAVERLT